MDMELGDLVLSKKGKREVSTFISQELIFEYAMDSLDPERKKAVEAALVNNKDLQGELRKIKLAIEYTSQLSKVKIKSGVVDEINAPETYLSVLLKKTNFEKWPTGVKWGIESLVVVSGLVLILTIAPWEKALRWGISPSGKEVILAEVTREQKVGDPEKLKEIEKTEPAQFSDELPKKTEATTIAVAQPVQVQEITQAPVATPAPANVKTVVLAAGAKGKETSPMPPAASAVAAAKSPAKPSEAAGKAQDKADSTDKAEPRVGFLYRGQIIITNLSAIGPKITDKITEFGGRKAGDVDLGWKKSPTSLYYHFTIPEAKYDELMSFLSQYGKAKLVKEKHPRVMPDGIIRLIITADEAKK